MLLCAMACAADVTVSDDAESVDAGPLTPAGRGGQNGPADGVAADEGAADEGAADEGAADEGATVDVAAEWTPSQVDAWHFLAEELEIQELHQALTDRHRPETLVIRDVRAIPMTEATPAAERKTAPQTIVIRDGTIAAIGAADRVDTPEGATVVDGTGRFAVPGLTDMHVHSLTSHSQHLLHLTQGVTSVRDLDGFPWLLRVRDAVASGRLLAPTLHVSGTILNGSDFGGYAIAIASVDEARAAVRAQAAAGYDFIKVHNSLSLELLRAITGEAKAHGLDVVGHIPVGVTVAEAADLGMRTFEHFKGYIDDSTLTRAGPENIVATRGREVWNTPTFSTYRNQLRGADAARILASDVMRYTSPRLRRQWDRFIDQEPTRLTALRQNVFPMSKEIFRELRRIEDARFLAGTDSGSYAMMTPGFILHEELRVFQELGMTPFETLETATVNPARAMRREGELGVLAAGARADVLLLDADPREDIANLRSIRGLVVRGAWLDRKALDAILDGLVEIYSRSARRLDEASVSRAEIDDYLARVKQLAARGFVFRDHDLELAAEMFDHLGRAEDAEILRRLEIDRDSRLRLNRFE